MKKRNPRHGSMQFWPRVRAQREHARVRTWGPGEGALGFAGYKVGMTHLIVKETTKVKGKAEIGNRSYPATIIECPPIKVIGIRYYQNDAYGSKTITQELSKDLDKTLSRTISLPKEQHGKQAEHYDFITLLVHTQPSLTGIGKKKPEIFEIGVGGKKEDQLAYAKEHLGKSIAVKG